MIMWVFRYDEEGRLVKIERDYGGGNISVAYEYGYNGDKDCATQQPKATENPS